VQMHKVRSDAGIARTAAPDGQPSKAMSQLQVQDRCRTPARPRRTAALSIAIMSNSIIVRSIFLEAHTAQLLSSGQLQVWKCSRGM
jgi:hypothetical protein